MSKLLLGAVVAGFGVATASAAEIETVVVTGSRIPVANLTSVSPIQTVTAREFQFKGATDVSDLMNDLVQNYQNNTADFSNTSNPLSSPGGVTTADLRGLGPQRTLVLVNSRRLGIGDPNTGNPNPAPDLDQIPVPLIDHVEVLTGGASATYGSDALAGVVNFIMKSDFEGLQIDAQYGGDWHDNSNSQARGLIATGIAGGLIGPISLPSSSVFDGRNVDASAVLGTNSADGRLNVTAYMVYRNADPVTQAERDFSECKINITSTAVCSGSANSNEVISLDGGQDLTVVGHSLLPWPQAGSSPPSLFNSNVYQYLSRQDTRYSGGVFAHYDINSLIKPYAEFSFMNDRSRTVIGPSALFEGGNIFDPNGAYAIHCNDPLLSAQEVNALCTANGLIATDSATVILGRRNIEGGGRIADYDHTNFRGVIGAKGDLGDAWHYDIYGSYYYTTLFQANSHYLGLSHAATALNECIGDSTGTCVPYNIWQTGGVTAAQLNYLYELGTSRGTTEEQILEADLTGDLGAYGLRSPWANDGVQIAIGASYRNDRLTYAGDAAEASGDLSGFGGAVVPIDNQISVTEEYGEIRIPLMQKLEFADDVVLLGGIRFSRYSTPHRPTTWKVGGEWAPNADFRLRASYDVAIRAASIIEAFTPQSVTNTSQVSEDPCAPDPVTHAATATAAQCALQGVTAGQYGNGIAVAFGGTNTLVQCPAGQCAILQGGNPNLSPEIGKSFSLGLTYTPTYIDGLTASIDYYDIKLTNLVGQIPVSLSMQECLNGVVGFCSNIIRTPAGFLFGTTIAGGGYIVGTSLNTARGEQTGIDFQGNYHVNLEDMELGNNGALDLQFVGTFQLLGKAQAVITSPMYDCTGLFGKTCNSPNPEWRHALRVSWTTPWDVVISPQWRYIGGVGLDTNTSQPGLTNHKFDAKNAMLPAMSYIDLAGSWQATSNFELRAGINNIFDKDPPIVSSLISGTGTPNTYPTYDLLGRTVYVAGTVKF